MLIPRQQQLEIIARKRETILQFLAEEIYSSQAVLGLLLGIQSRQGVYTTLKRLEREGTVRAAPVTMPSGKKHTLWGLTPHGAGMAWNPETHPEPPDRWFEPSRIGLTVLEHTLDLQWLRLTADRAGWNSWEYGDRLGKWEAGISRPDAIAADPAGRILAIECERTLKSYKRYESILADRLQSIRSGQFERVVWVSPNDDFRDKLKRVLLSIKAVPVAGARVAVQPRHHAVLEFLTYAEWPAAISNQAEGGHHE